MLVSDNVNLSQKICNSHIESGQVGQSHFGSQIQSEDFFSHIPISECGASDQQTPKSRVGDAIVIAIMQLYNLSILTKSIPVCSSYYNPAAQYTLYSTLRSHCFSKPSGPSLVVKMPLLLCAPAQHARWLDGFSGCDEFTPSPANASAVSNEM